MKRFYAVSIRPEAVEIGVMKLLGANYERIVAGVQPLLDDSTHGISPCGNGKAAVRIMNVLREHFT